VAAPPFLARVRSYELDALGHANHAVFLNWFEQARWDALAAAGLPAKEILARGWGVHVVRIEVDYRAECLLDDEIRVETWVESVRNSSMVLRQELLRQAPDRPEALAAEARVVAVFVGPNGRPMRIPGGLRETFGSWIGTGRARAD
jgi:YbgC/YbaW family acyl-CoA thioester hydrolase